jgi:pimeloyl-ACP methyl ester carboxylesterase
MAETLPSVDVNGVRIAYRRAGEGRPLVLLHGAVSDSRVWRRELEAFCDEFTVVAWDAPGCGQSSDAPESFRFDDYVRCLGGLLTALALRRPHVVGHSWGSTLALAYALAAHAGHIAPAPASLILVGGYAGWAGSLPRAEVERRVAFASNVADQLERDASSWQPRSMRGLFSERMEPEQATELADIMREIRPAATRSMAFALADADLRAELGAIEVPTLILSGDADERSPVPAANALHDAIAGSAFVLLPGLGHECLLEDPPTCQAAIRTFLATVS